MEGSYMPFKLWIQRFEICCEQKFDILECAISKCCGCEEFSRSAMLHLADAVREDGSVARKMD